MDPVVTSHVKANRWGCVPAGQAVVAMRPVDKDGFVGKDELAKALDNPDFVEKFIVPYYLAPYRLKDYDGDRQVSLTEWMVELSTSSARCWPRSEPDSPGHAPGTHGGAPQNLSQNPLEVNEATGGVQHSLPEGLVAAGEQPAGAAMLKLESIRTGVNHE